MNIFRCPRCGLPMGRDHAAEERHAAACLHDVFMGQALDAAFGTMYRSGAMMSPGEVAATAKAIADELMKNRGPR